MRQTTGLLAGRYRLDSPIASGGVGEVWRAFDLVLDRPVAVKVLRSEYAGQRQALDRFRAEARHAGSVSHPAIAQVYDYGEDPEVRAPFLVMELVDGPSLADLLAEGPLDPATTMDVLAQAAAGLQAAHAAGLVHRDVKPGNLLIGAGGQVKITDFGIAHAAGSVPITRTGMVVGMPFEVAGAHQHRELPPLPSTVPAGAARLIAGLTAKDPVSRPASAAAVSTEARRVRDYLTGGAPSRLAATATTPFRSDLGNARSGTLVDAHPLTWHTAPAGHRGRARRRGRGVLLALGAAVVGGLATWIVMSALPAAHQSPPGPPGPTVSSPATQTVDVNSADLVGQQASDVSQTLCNLGLTPVMTFTSSSLSGQGGQDPGTVLSVSPSGLVAVGSPVTVTVFRGHHHDLGNVGNTGSCGNDGGGTSSGGTGGGGGN